VRKQGEEEVSTGEYRYHLFKPTIATAVCRWHEALASPDNFEGTEQKPIHWSDSREER
jgi:hypothetical protein